MLNNGPWCSSELLSTSVYSFNHSVLEWFNMHHLTCIFFLNSVQVWGLFYWHAVEHPWKTCTQNIFQCIPVSTRVLFSFKAADNRQCKREDTFFVICGKYFRFEVLWVSSWNRSQNQFYFTQKVGSFLKQFKTKEDQTRDDDTEKGEK